MPVLLHIVNCICSLLIAIMYYAHTGIVTHVICLLAQTDHGVTFPPLLISRYVLCCVLFINIIFHCKIVCMLYVVFAIFFIKKSCFSEKMEIVIK